MSICIKPDDRTSIFCHLCKLNFSSHEELKMHIMKKHRPSSKFYEGDSDDSEQVDFAENCKRSQRDPKCKLERYDEDNSLDYEDFDDQNSYNISETAVSPQSSHHRCKNKKHSPKAKFNPSKVKREFEETGNSAHLSAPDVMDFNSISSSASQIAPQMISFGNQINPQLNHHMFVDNQLQLINPYNQQSNYLIGNQPALQFNPVVISPLPSRKAFDFNAKNIIKWYNKFKKMSKSMKYPLQRKVLLKMKKVQLDLYHNCSFPRVFAEKEKSLLLKIYQELGLIMCKNNEVTQDML